MAENNRDEVLETLKRIEEKVDIFDRLLKDIVEFGESFQEFLEERKNRASTLVTEVKATVESKKFDKSIYDDPIVRNDPPGWNKKHGTTFVGKKFSECSDEYLADMISFLKWASEDDRKKGTLTSNGKPRAHYRLLDMQRAISILESRKQKDVPETSKEVSKKSGEEEFSFEDA